ncbi:MAG: peptidoglycan editing factor PgeF [Alphaproteobacteria bacterium]|nr:peptidoglycan editing factor PgeF [Alphaproteobacteria bacterium]
MFYFDYIEGRKVLKSDLLSGLEHFFTTRELCLFSKEEDMSANRGLVESYFREKMATNQPVHGVDIAKVEADKYFYEKTDALLVEKGAAYMNFGDCTPLVFSFSKGAMIAHAGWRGTVQMMAKVAVKRICEEYGIKPQDIKVAIGPAICGKCYDVGQDVYQALLTTVNGAGQGFAQRDNKCFVDLKQINQRQLSECGVKQIDVCPYCTACGEKQFYSYRYEKTGYRHSAVVRVL